MLSVLRPYSQFPRRELRWWRLGITRGSWPSDNIRVHFITVIISH